MDTVSSVAARPSNRHAFGAVLRIFSAPSSVLADVKAGLPWWPGLLVLGVLVFGMGLLLLPLKRELTALDVASGQVKGMELAADGQLPAPLRWKLIGEVVGGPLIGVPLGLLAVAFFYWLALTITFGGAPYRRLFTLSVYTSFIGMAYQLLNSLYLRFAGLEMTSMKDIQGNQLKLSLGALVSGDGFVASFLGLVGIFQLWELWIFVAGVALLLNRKRSAILAPVLVVFLLGMALSAFLITLSTRLGG